MSGNMKERERNGWTADRVRLHVAGGKYIVGTSTAAVDELEAQ